MSSPGPRRQPLQSARWRPALKATILGLLTCSHANAVEEASAATGRRLYVGERVLVARIVGQDFPLPGHASRCVNCHGQRLAASAASATGTAPALTAATLAEPVRRRGGPPSSYDAVALCKLLRAGIDPGHVVIARTMPRYEISEPDCRSLWLHLTGRP